VLCSVLCYAGQVRLFCAMCCAVLCCAGQGRCVLCAVLCCAVCCAVLCAVLCCVVWCGVVWCAGPCWSATSQRTTRRGFCSRCACAVLCGSACSMRCGVLGGPSSQLCCAVYCAVLCCGHGHGGRIPSVCRCRPTGHSIATASIPEAAPKLRPRPSTLTRTRPPSPSVHAQVDSLGGVDAAGANQLPTAGKQVRSWGDFWGACFSTCAFVARHCFQMRHR
jgi:hypothetical protein